MRSLVNSFIAILCFALLASSCRAVRSSRKEDAASARTETSQSFAFGSASFLRDLQALSLFIDSIEIVMPGGLDVCDISPLSACDSDSMCQRGFDTSCRQSRTPSSCSKKSGGRVVIHGLSYASVHDSVSASKEAFADSVSEKSQQDNHVVFDTQSRPPDRTMQYAFYLFVAIVVTGLVIYLRRRLL